MSDILNRFSRYSGSGGKRIIVSIWGKEKTGKTHFALTFPEPIVFLDFDLGLEGVIDKFGDKRIYWKAYTSRTPELTVADANRMLMEFVDDYQNALNLGAGTIVVDTATHLWQLIQKVRMDEIKRKREKKGQEVYPFDYADANAYYQNLVNAVKSTKLNLVLLHRAREIYDARGHKTGEFEAQQNNGTPYLVQIVIHLEKRKHERVATIESCRMYPELEGVSLTNAGYSELVKLLRSNLG